MLSKKQYAKAIIHNFAEAAGQTHNTEEELYKSLQDDIVGDGNNADLAVAMEYLGLIESEEDKKYAARVDKCVVEFHEGSYISVRDLLYGSPNYELPNEVRTCKTCGEQFSLYQRDIDFYERKGFQLPVRCKPCRDKFNAEKREREQRENAA